LLVLQLVLNKLRDKDMPSDRDEALMLLEKFSNSLPHVEALYMYVNRGVFKGQCLEELEARWPSIGSKAWSEVEAEASKYEPHILVGDLKRRVIRAIEERYGDLLLKEVERRIQALGPSELAVVTAFSKTWLQGLKTTDEDELSTILEACLGIRGSKAVEILWKTGLINRAHRPATSRYMPKVYVPGYLRSLIERLAQAQLPIRMNVKALLERALAEDPFKACAAVYGANQLIDELVQTALGLPITSVLHKWSIEGLMKAGKACPLLADEIEKAWREIVEDAFSETLNTLSESLKSLNYKYRAVYDVYIKLPILYGYRDGLAMAIIFMPAVLPLTHVRSFSPDALKVAFTHKLNVPPREALNALRLSSIIWARDKEVVLYAEEGLDVLEKLLKMSGFDVVQASP
jgi:hypothetical protein